MTKFPFARVLPYAILLGGFALRLFRLGVEGLWYDETVSLLLARSDLAELTRHTASDIHPPLYYYLLYFWGQFAGWSEFAAAYLSLVFGVLLIALVYYVTREWFIREVAAIAALLVACSPFNVWYSQEVRMYTLGAVLGLASVYLLMRLLRTGKIFAGDFVAYVIVTTLGLYTLYYFVFLLVFQYVVVLGWLLVTGRSSLVALRSSLLSFILAQVAVGLLYLPWLPIAFRQAWDPPVPPWRTFAPLQKVLIESLSALTLGQSVEPMSVWPLLLLAAVLIALLFIRQSRVKGNLAPLPRGHTIVRPVVADAQPGTLFLLAYTSIPLLAIFALSFWKPLYHVRYTFTYSPAFYILLALAIYVSARAIAGINARLAPLFIGGMLLVFTVAFAYSLRNFWYDPQYADDDLRGAVHHLAENWRPGDAILVNAGYAYPALAYYYPDTLASRMRLVNYQATNSDWSEPLALLTGSIDGNSDLGWGDPRSDFYATTADETRAALDRVFQTHPRVWMLRVYDTVTDPDGVIRQYFADHAQLIDDQGFTGEANARVQGFLTQTFDELPPGAIVLNVSLADRITLLGFETGAHAPLQGGEYFDAVLYWQPRETLNYNYQLSLQILDGAGNLVAQRDETPLGSALPTTRWRTGQIYREPVRLPLPKSIAPGNYDAIVKMYRLSDGEVLGGPVALVRVQIVSQ